jgi:hypothetical protein
MYISIYAWMYFLNTLWVTSAYSYVKASVVLYIYIFVFL